MKRILPLLLIALFSYSTIYSQTGRSLHFDGVNDGVNIGTPLFDINNGNQTYTIEAWIKTSVGDDDCIVCQYDWPGYYRFQFQLRNDKLEWWKGIGTTSISVLSSQSVADGSWHHVAATINNSGAVQLYVDGVADGSGVDTSQYDNYPTSLGKRFPTNSGMFEGNMAEVRIWNKVRTASEIMNNMCPSEEFDTTGLIAYYKFNQGTAGASNASIITLNDETPNQHNGALDQFGLTGATSNWVSETPCWPVFVSDYLNKKEITISPNPARNAVSFGDLVKGRVIISDVLGRNISEAELTNAPMDVSQLNAGTYFVKILSDGDLYVAKLVITD